MCHDSKQSVNLSKVNHFVFCQTCPALTSKIDTLNPAPLIKHLVDAKQGTEEDVVDGSLVLT